MSLNIKDEETHDLARELAQLRGTTLTSAVKEAVREVLEKEKAQRSEQGHAHKKSRFELLVEFSALSAPHFRADRTGNELIQELYDEKTGLPR